MVLRDEHVASRTFMIITRAMPTQQTAITGVLRRITAGQEIKAGLCRGPAESPEFSNTATSMNRRRHAANPRHVSPNIWGAPFNPDRAPKVEWGGLNGVDCVKSTR